MIPVVVRMPNWLGDVVMATPVLELLHASKKYETHLLIRRPWGALFRTDPRVFRLIDCEDSIASIPVTASELRGLVSASGAPGAAVYGRGQCVAAIDLTHSFRSRLLMFASGLRRVLREENQSRDSHQIDRYLAVARRLDDGLSDESPSPALYPAAAPPVDARRVAIFPGSAYGPAKQWSEESWIELMRQLAARGLRPRLFGTSREQELISRLAASGAARPNDPGSGAVESAIDLPLSELMIELKRCAVAVACDSGPAHLAAALNVPVVALFLSTSPDRTAPRGRAVHVLTADVDCRPCYQRTCTIGYICRPRITPERVMSELSGLSMG